MDTVGLRELRRHAGGLVRRAEAGETIAVTVGGRPVAQLGPITPGRWRTWNEIAAIFDDSAVVDTPTEGDHIDQRPSDPYSR